MWTRERDGLAVHGQDEAILGRQAVQLYGDLGEHPGRLVADPHRVQVAHGLASTGSSTAQRPGSLVCVLRVI